MKDRPAFRLPIQPDPPASPSADIRAEQAFDKGLKAKLAKLKKNWAGIMSAVAIVTACGAWAEARLLSSAKAYTDTKVDVLDKKVDRLNTNVDDIKFYWNVPSRPPATQP